MIGGSIALEKSLKNLTVMSITMPVKNTNNHNGVYQNSNEEVSLKKLLDQTNFKDFKS
jgi:hypothetical protein